MARRTDDDDRRRRNTREARNSDNDRLDMDRPKSDKRNQFDGPEGDDDELGELMQTASRRSRAAKFRKGDVA